MNTKKRIKRYVESWDAGREYTLLFEELWQTYSTDFHAEDWQSCKFLQGYHRWGRKAFKTALLYDVSGGHHF